MGDSGHTTNESNRCGGTDHVGRGIRPPMNAFSSALFMRWTGNDLLTGSLFLLNSQTISNIVNSNNKN